MLSRLAAATDSG